MALKGGLLRLEKLKLEHLYATYLGMNAKEQTIALVVVAAVVLLMIVIPVTIASRSITSLERSIEQSRKDEREVMQEIGVYNEAHAELASLEAALSGGFDSAIATTLEGLATTVGIKDRIDALKEKPTTPSEFFEQSSVDVRLKQVRLSELVDFLFQVEHHPTKVLRLESLDIKPRFDNKDDLDASFTISTFHLLSTEAAEAPGEEEGTP